MKIYFSNWKVRPPAGNIILKKIALNFSVQKYTVHTGYVWKGSYIASGATLIGGCRGCTPPLRWNAALRWHVVYCCRSRGRDEVEAFFLFAIKIWLRLVTSQLRHSLVVHPLLKKVLDPPLCIDDILAYVICFPGKAIGGVQSQGHPTYHQVAYFKR